MRTEVVFAATALITLTSASAWGAAFNVDDLADAVDVAPGNGACATARGTCTLRAAVQETNALAGADQIALAVGVQELTIGGAGEDAGATGDLDITDDLTIAGANAYLSVIDANGIDRVLDQDAPADTPLELTLRDLTITGGNTDDSGGGLRYSSGVDALRIIVRQNQASEGGGLATTDTATDEPALSLRVSIVSLNEAVTLGGGIRALYSDEFSIEQSIVIANAAGFASGGISSFDNSAQLDQVTVYGNNGVTGCGGIGSDFGISVEQSWIGHNLAGSWGVPPGPGIKGGGLCVSNGLNDAIVNTTIEGNLAEEGGGILVNEWSEMIITHATIARNRAIWPGGGGGMHVEDNILDLQIENTIIAGNTPKNCGQYVDYVASAGHNLADDDSCNLGAMGDLESADAQLGALANYGGLTRTIPPLPGSPAIEGGANAGTFVDQRGVTRPQFAQFDIGAVEKQELGGPRDETGGSANNPGPCDLDRNGRVDFADLDRLIATFPAAGGRFRGNAAQRLKQCVASCTHAGCPPLALIRKPAAGG